MVRRIYKYTGLAIFIVLLCACSKPSAHVTSSIILDKSCSPPCWEQLTPGKTTRNEVKATLVDSSWVNQTTIKDYSSVIPNDSIRWLGSSASADRSGTIYFHHDIVALINISPDANGLKFADLIGKLGKPESVLAFIDRGEKSTIVIYILYPTKGYGFSDYYYTTSTNFYTVIPIKPEESVKDIWYGEPNSLQGFLTSGQIDRLPDNFIQQNLQRWNGFGTYTLTFK